MTGNGFIIKRTILCAYILFKVLRVLMAQDALHLEAYEDLRPDINVFVTEDGAGNYARKLLFYGLQSMEPPMLICGLPSNDLRPFPAKQMGMGDRRMFNEHFWDPHTKTTYMYCRDSVRDEKMGWYSLAFFGNILEFYLQSRYQYWAQSSPVNVQLADARIFTARYIDDPNGFINNSGDI